MLCAMSSQSRELPLVVECRTGVGDWCQSKTGLLTRTNRRKQLLSRWQVWLESRCWGSVSEIYVSWRVAAAVAGQWCLSETMDRQTECPIVITELWWYSDQNVVKKEASQIGAIQRERATADTDIEDAGQSERARCSGSAADAVDWDDENRSFAGRTRPKVSASWWWVLCCVWSVVMELDKKKKISLD